MTRWIGRWLMGVGVVHVAFGVVIFADPLGAILADGVWNAVDGYPGRPLAFWFLVVGFMTIITGSLTDWIEAHLHTVPPHLGWGLLVLLTLAVVTMPLSGGWLFLPPTIGALMRSTSDRAGRGGTTA